MSQQSSKVRVTGNVGGDPITRFNDKNTLIANFSVAVNDERRDRNGVTTKRTNWYNVTATGKQAEILAEHLKKGDAVQIEGKLSFNPYLANDGKPQVAADVLCADFTFMGGGRARSADGNDGNTSSATGSSTVHDGATAETDFVPEYAEAANSAALNNYF
jgi:single-strand DNA-binding protein